jgi:hypothetical protein
MITESLAISANTPQHSPNIENSAKIKEITYKSDKIWQNSGCLTIFVPRMG